MSGSSGSAPNLDLLLLEVLASGPSHGYGVIATLRERSDGVLDLAEGTIYPALHRLERDGLTASAPELVAGRVRRVYRLTPTGKATGLARRDDWRRYATAVESVLRRPVTP